MKTIVLHGELAKRYGKTHKFAVRNAAEALRALKANFAGFEQYMAQAHLSGIGFKLFVGRSPVADYPEIHNPSGETEVIRLVPIIMGSGALGKILVGAFLIAAAVIAAPFTGGFSLTLVNSVGMIGASLVIGGVATLLTGNPGTPSAAPERKSSYIFNGPANTSVQGAAIPVGYGRVITGSVVISSGIETHEI
jgi:predicted phage tail protein